MSTTNHITVQLPQFEGPLALLLYLIRKEEMDIMNIQIHKITHQYLEFIKLMKELDLEVAGEFVAMAATLIQIKSRMLLPQYDEHGDVIESEDPRKELVQRLLEYQKYQEASKLLYERPLLGRDVFARGVREKLEGKEDEIVLDDNPVFSLISAYRRAVKTAKNKIHQVTAKLQSIANRILEIKDLLIVGQKVPMSEFITAPNSEGRRNQILITFLSVLELGKIGFVSLFQTDIYQEIYVEAKHSVLSDVFSKIEEYDNLRSEDFASEMILKSEVVDLNDDAIDVSDEFDNNLNQVESVQNDVILAPIEQMATDDEIALAEKELMGEV